MRLKRGKKLLLFFVSFCRKKAKKGTGQLHSKREKKRSEKYEN